MKDWNSEHYKAYNSGQEEAALDVLKEIHLKGDEKILDIGCGDGKITRYLAKKLPRGEAIGIDISPNMFRQAKKDHDNIKNLYFFRKSADNFSFEKKFDLIFSFACLHWVKQQEMVLKCVKSSLKKGGFFYFSCLMRINPYIEQILRKKKWRLLYENQDKQFFPININKYKKLLAHLGFHLNQLEVKECVHYFSNTQESINSIMTYLPHLIGLKEDLCFEIANEIGQKLPRKKKGNQEWITLSYDILHIKASLS